MPNNTGNGQDEVPTLTLIVRHLISECGDHLHLPGGVNQLADHIAGATKLARGTLLGILNGGRHGANKNTRESLAKFFNQVAVPRLEPNWFSSASLGEFLSKRSETPELAIRVPADYWRKAQRLEVGLCGTYICYRYGFDAINSGDVAREVLHMWREGAALKFKMSFVPRSRQADDAVYQFDGPVVLAGRSAVLVGTNIGTATEDREHDRVRSIFFDHDHGGVKEQDCWIGLLTSTRLRDDFAPCSACTILVKVRKTLKENELAQLMTDATCVDSFDKVIVGDFGPKYVPLLKLFLDNRLLGTPIDDDMQAWATPVMRPDRALRLNPGRFAANMPEIIKEALDDPTIRAPFKPNWFAPAPPPAAAGAQGRVGRKPLKKAR
jgi:hypothetical protein